MKIELILIGVIGAVFLADFLFRGLKKSIKSDSIVKQTEHKKENPKRRVNAVVVIVIWVLLGLVIGYLIDFQLNPKSLHKYFFVGDFKLYTTETIEYNFIFGYLVASLVFICAKNFQYFKKRKKNTVLFTLTIMITKVCAHYFFYPMVYGGRRRSGTPPIEKGFGVHLDTIFTEELWLFVPSILIISFIAWFFNDKIKAR
jgi:hypothetical protein